MNNTEFNIPKESDLLFETPVSYYDVINESVIGQKDLKETLSVCCFRHTLFSEDVTYKPNHMLVIGPSGTGKTFTITTLLKHLNINHVLFDSSTVTVTGYVGATFDSAVTYLYNASGNNITKTERGVIIFDEIDKLFTNADSNRTDFTRSSAQNELLRLLEGNIVQIQTNPFNEEPIFINTSKILFIFLGSFNSFKHILFGEGMSLYETKEEREKRKIISPIDMPTKLLNCGLSSELVGRISYFSQTLTLTKEEIKNIILYTKNPIIDIYKKYFNSFNVLLTLDDSFIDYIINESQFENFGVRRIIQLFNFHLNNLMFGIEKIKKESKNINIKYENKKVVFDIQ